MEAEQSPLIRRSFMRRNLAICVAAFAIEARADEKRPAPPRGPKKRTRESVGYRDFPYENRACAKCMLYVGNGECVIVEGKVSIDGWCNQWTPPTIGQSPTQLQQTDNSVPDELKIDRA